VKQVSARTAFVAVLAPLVLGASVTMSAVRADDALPATAASVKAALTTADEIGLCLQDASRDLTGTETATPTPSDLEAARDRLRRCQLPAFIDAVEALDVPAAAPVQPRRAARARAQLAESIRLIEQATADARTAFRVVETTEVEAQFVIIAYRSFDTARARADRLYAEAAAALTPDVERIPTAPRI
jgi:hypothetical protein